MAVDVRMRAVDAADSQRLLAWRNQPDIRRWMYTDHEIIPEEHARWFETAMDDPGRRYWIVELDGAPVGLANLADIDIDHGRATWAYYLADPAARGRGVGAFVEYWVIEQVFGLMGLSRLWCEVLIDNAGVIKLHERFGFRREALFEKHVIKDGKATDVVGLGLLAEDWAQVREALGDSLRRLGFPL